MVSMYFIHLSRYEVIIFEYHLVTRSEVLVGHNQTSSFVKLSALSSVLVRMYWLDDKGLLLCSLIIVRAYWLDDKETSLIYHWVR